MDVKKLVSEEYDLMLKFINTHENIYIYGAGNIAKNICEFLKDNNKKVSGFIVSNIENNPSTFEGISVHSKEILSSLKNFGIIIAAKLKHWKNIDIILRDYKIENKNIHYQHFNLNPDEISGFRDNTFLLPRDRFKGEFFENNHELSDISKALDTDKTDIGNLLKKYEFFFKNFKEDKFSMIELGIFHGGSLKLWKNYFPNAIIYGVDINSECKKFEEDHIKIIIKNLSDEKNITQLSEIQPKLILDDASHIWSHQINCLINLFDALQSGGIYVIEDIGTSFKQTLYFAHFADIEVSAYDFCSALAECVTGGEHLNVKNKPYYIGILKDIIEKIAIQIDMISFVDNSCIIVKK